MAPPPRPAGRPLSPHIFIYRWRLPAILSILHRMTGAALTLGTLLLVYWLLAAAAGPPAFETAQGVIGSWLGRLLLFGWSWALFFHLANGVRHLFWDAGRGYALPTAYRSGWTVVALSLLLTLAAWTGGYASAGLL